MENYFLRVPNSIIKSKQFNAKMVCTQFLLNETRGLSEKSLTSIGYLIDNCGYTPRRGKGGINNKYLTILNQLETDNFITLDTKCYFNEKQNAVNDLIVCTINPDKFDCVDDFTQLNVAEFNTLIRDNHYRNKEALLHIYLYVKSYYHHQHTALNRPMGFFQNLTTISVATGMTEKTLIKLLTMLVDLNLLTKYYVGSVDVQHSGDGKTRKNVPNIYIPNLGQSQDEIDDAIKSTVDMMKEFYKVKNFLPFMYDSKEN